LKSIFEVSIEFQQADLSKCRFKGTFEQVGLEEILQVISSSINGNYYLKDGKYVIQGESCSQVSF
jgi:hypothetical protein